MLLEPGQKTHALFEAIQSGDSAGIDALVRGGVDVNARGRDGETPLVAATAAGDVPAMKRLLAAGADPDLPDEEGNVPLAYALLRRDPAATTALLEANAHADASPSLLASAAAHAPVDVVEAMLDRGADPNARDAQGRTAFLAACASGHLRTAALLLARGADVRARDDDGTTSLLALLEGTGRARLLADVAALRSQAGTSIEALRRIAREVAARAAGLGLDQPPELLLPDGFREVFDGILERGARVDVVDELGRNALAIAVCEAYPRPIVEALLAYGADPHRADEDGLTALDFADMHPDPEVRVLLEARSH